MGGARVRTRTGDTSCEGLRSESDMGRSIKVPAYYECMSRKGPKVGRGMLDFVEDLRHDVYFIKK